MNREDIEAQFKAIRDVLDTEVSQGDIVGAEDNLLKLKAIAGNGAEMVRVCEAEILSRQKDIISEYMDKKLTPTVLDMIVKGSLPYEFASLSYAKKLCDAIEHSIKALITVISLYKQEMANSR